jgi:alkylation response protein AidB-like acyl-CoA dehydrogenase
MDFSYSTEQKMLSESVKRFVSDHYDLIARDIILGSEGGFSRSHWQTYADLGWLGVALPEEYGGLDGGPQETMIIMEELGGGLAMEPYLSSVVLCGQLINRAASISVKERILPSLIGGKTLLAFAHAETQARYDLTNVTTTAKLDGDGYLINGQKCAVLHAATADHIIISARTSGADCDEQGISLFLVDGAVAEISRRDYRTLDDQRASDLTISNLRLPADALLGDVGAACPVIIEVMDIVISAYCAEAVGAMRQVSEITREYMQTREQFGEKLSQFQALRHRLVDVFTECDKAKSMSMMAAIKVESSDVSERRIAVSAAKALIGKAARFVGAQGVQLHGGMALTNEYPAGHYFKRLTVFNSLFGDVEFHMERFVSHVDQD